MIQTIRRLKLREVIKKEREFLSEDKLFPTLCFEDCPKAPSFQFVHLMMHNAPCPRCYMTIFVKAQLKPKGFHCFNLIFWIVMTCGIGYFGQRCLKTPRY